MLWFYRQNGYLDYEKVAQMEISAPQSFIKRQFGEEAITFLETCCVGQPLVGQVESAIEDCCSTGGYLELSSALPTVANETSAKEILEFVCKKNKQNPCQLFDTTSEFFFFFLSLGIYLMYLPVQSSPPSSSKT